MVKSILKNEFNYFLSLIVLGTCLSCNKGTDEDESTQNTIQYQQEMRDFVVFISHYSKAINPNFKIIPQNGIELVSEDEESTNITNDAYLEAIDGNGQEDLYYGYNEDNRATPEYRTDYLQRFLDISKNAGKTILVTDYCSTHSKMTDSYSKNMDRGFVSFAADTRELNVIPDFPTPIVNENNANITQLYQVKNFLYLINPEGYASKSSFISAVTSTNYDLLIMDLFFTDGTAFSESEITQLKQKSNGGKRLVISYMSIGEAENYRYYWKFGWTVGNPDWLDAVNPDWPGNYRVNYWSKDWQDIIYGNNDSYLKKVLDVGFDGVYLDIIDAFEYYNAL